VPYSRGDAPENSQGMREDPVKAGFFENMIEGQHQDLKTFSSAKLYCWFLVYYSALYFREVASQ
tara:strand:- start:74 stop:265 length:192 start_codon:yes stop_codon:yes gene_type:complete